MKNVAGLTLVELLVALAIVALLTAGALYAITACARSDRVGAAWQADTHRQQSLRDLLALDFAQATKLRKTASGFELQTVASLNAGTMELEHLGSTVGYEVAAGGTHGCLVRSQTSPDQPALRELVLPEVRSVNLEFLGATALAAGDSWGKAPDAVTVTIAFDQSPPLVMTLRRR